MSAYLIRQATPADLEAVLALRAEAEEWLRRRGIRQWTPDYDDYARAVLTEWVHSGSAWVVEHGGQVVATVSVSAPDPDFWGWADDLGDALYLGKMIVARAHAGQSLGAAIMNWASLKAAAAGVRWVRIDVRRDNDQLHRYYLDRGFSYVRTYHDPGRRTESGWLAQRPAGTLTPTSVELVVAAQGSGTARVIGAPP